MSSTFILGPCQFDHQVQKIQVVERKAIEVLDTVRSTDHFIKDSGESSNIIEVKLLFSSLEEINAGIGPKSGLRGLIALFRTCPIINCYNQELSNIFQKIDNENKYSLFSVIIKSLSLETVPELINSIQATLLIEVVDVSMFFNNGANSPLIFQGSSIGGGAQQEYYWLSKWITKLLDTRIPFITESDFLNSYLSLYLPDTSRLDLIEDQERESKVDNAVLNLNISKSNVGASLTTLAHSCTVSHKFALNKPMGKAYPYPSHMGSTARYCSFDFVFNNQTKQDSTYTAFDVFYYIKEYTDKLRRSSLAFDKALGVRIITPITKLLDIKFDNYEESDIYTIAFLNTETSEVPGVINTRLDVVENNISFREDNQVLQVSGGTDVQKLKEYFDSIVKGEKEFRKQREIDPAALALSIAGITDQSKYEEYSIFWPIERVGSDFRASARLGLLNIDTLRAVFLHPKIDKDGSLRKALTMDPWASGQMLVNNENTIGFFTRLGYGMRSLYTSFYTLGLIELLPSKKVYDIITQYVNQYIEFNYPDDVLSQKDMEYHRNQIIDGLFVGFYGDIGGVGVAVNDKSATGNLLKKIASGHYKIQLRSDFYDALFNVIVERTVKPPELPYIYNEEGVHSAFFKLIHHYVKSIQERTESEIISELQLPNNLARRGHDTYPDLLLPTYVELYESRWKEFAPTYEDLGIQQEISTDVDGNKLLAVTENDIVSPACWFYIERSKDKIKENLSKAVNAYKDSKFNEKMSISIPFSTEDLETIETEQVNRNAEDPVLKEKSDKTIADLIEKSLLEVSRTEPSKFREIYTNLESINNDPDGAKLDEMVITLKTNFHHNGNRCAPKRLSSRGLGGIIYRKAKEIISLTPVEDSSKGTISTTSVVDKTVQFKRGMMESSEQNTLGMLSQISDFYYSPERMFPAVKVYLIDRRGNDVLSDDIMYQVNPIISVDITLDKDDADLAVIKLADPLYQLQTDFFNNRNLTKLNTSSNDIVLGSLRDNRNSLIKRYKLEQGRSIQIRMGYTSVADNLPIVFTGRITEIISGEELVIVAQGWKAELINRQVSFINRDNNSVGARDLAIQTISIANPDGVGDVFGIADTEVLLKTIPSTDISNIYSQVISNSDNVEVVDGRTSRGILDRFKNWLYQAIGLGSNNSGRRGLDTRLKNIWYPDVTGFNNLFGWRDWFGVYPDFLNDSWVIPIQPAWDVLKEAARSGWNCIVQVIPFDTQATIFMGNPDQPYYYTRGNPVLTAYYNKKYKKQKLDRKKELDRLFELFQNSSYFTDITPIPNLQNLYRNNLIRYGSSNPNTQIGQYSNLIDYINNAYSTTNFIENIKAINYFSNLGISTSSLFSDFFNISESTLPIWINYESDIRDIATIDQTTTSEIPEEIVKRMQLALDSADASSWIGDGSGPSRVFSNQNNDDVSKLFTKALDIVNEYSKAKVTMLNREDYKLKDIAKEFSDIGLTEASELFDNIRNRLKYIENQIYEVLINPENDKFANVLKKANSLGFNYYNFKYRDRTNNRYWRNGQPIPIFSFDEDTEKELASVDSMLQSLVIYLQSKLTKVKNNNKLSDRLPTKFDIEFKDSLDKVLFGYRYFNAYLYFFYKFLLESGVESKDIQTKLSTTTNVLPPNMRPFRVIHYINNKHNIIKNEITATTREMWNTVVIEHPSEGDLEGVADGEDQFSVSKLSAGANWVYYPTQEVTGVIGLQFHPGLTLANKKVEVFTELNCQTKDVAAKYACHHLAEGIKRMYRGTIVLSGTNIKPHDIAIMNDSYRRLSGPIEVESVVHHFNASMGWVTNIIPQAMATANPRASILEVALMEATFQSVYNTIEFMSDAATITAIVATLGAAAPAAAGKFAISNSVKQFAKSLFNTKTGLVGSIRNTGSIYLKGLRALPSIAKSSFTEKGVIAGTISLYGNTIGGLANNLLLNEFLAASTQWGMGIWFKHGIISSFVQTSEKYEQLPVILSPLMNGMLPYTAGLETQDSIFAIPGFGTYYSYKQMQAGYTALVDELLR